MAAAKGGIQGTQVLGASHWRWGPGGGKHTGQGSWDLQWGSQLEGDSHRAAEMPFLAPLGGGHTARVFILGEELHTWRGNEIHKTLDSHTPHVTGHLLPN